MTHELEILAFGQMLVAATQRRVGPRTPLRQANLAQFRHALLQMIDLVEEDTRPGNNYRQPALDTGYELAIHGRDVTYRWGTIDDRVIWFRLCSRISELGVNSSDYRFRFAICRFKLDEGQTSQQMGKFDAARQVLREAVRLAKKLFEDMQRGIVPSSEWGGVTSEYIYAETILQIAQTEFLSGNYSEARTDIAQTENLTLNIAQLEAAYLLYNQLGLKWEQRSYAPPNSIAGKMEATLIKLGLKKSFLEGIDPDSMIHVQNAIAARDERCFAMLESRLKAARESGSQNSVAQVLYLKARAVFLIRQDLELVSRLLADALAASKEAKSDWMIQCCNEAQTLLNQRKNPF